MWKRLLDKMISIKFLAWFMLFVFSGFALWCNRLDPKIWAETAKWSFMALVFGNGVVHIAGKFGRNGRDESKPNP